MTTRWFRNSVFIFFFILLPAFAQGQKYDLFEVSNDELHWRNTYQYNGTADSLRREVVQMLKSKFFTFNVIRNEMGYNGEILHYRVDCKRYGRTYFNTPRMYSEGEWTGKFIVEVLDHYYRVTVYALYGEKIEKSAGFYRTDKISRGRYLNMVMKKNKTDFKRNELPNLALMSLSLKDQFDIRNATLPPGN